MAFKGAAITKHITLATFRSCNYYSSGLHIPAAKSAAAAAANIIFLFQDLCKQHCLTIQSLHRRVSLSIQEQNLRKENPP